jgi:uncharacterized protein YjfI (DUF2170 family)
MELALLVYGISLFNSLGIVLVIILILSSLVVIAASLCILDNTSDTEFWKSILKKATIVLSISLPIIIIIPGEKTMYTMVGAYAAQKVTEDPKVQLLSAKVLKVVEAKLDEYIEKPKK